METTNYKIGDRFESKTGRIFEIVSFTKNYHVIIYNVTYKGKTIQVQGLISEVIKYNKIN